jgi:hypothetical protein
VVTQHERIRSVGLTFEDVFFVKLYTFSQWVHCVRFCGVNISDCEDHVKDTVKLGDFIKQACEHCGLRSDQDSWYTRFNADTRGSGTKAKYWSDETRKLTNCLKKMRPKETKFFRGFNIPMDKCDHPLTPLSSSKLIHVEFRLFFDVVDADDSLKTHGGGYKAEVERKRYKNVHFSDDHTVAFVVNDDHAELGGVKDLSDIFDTGGKLLGKMTGPLFEPDAKIADKVFVVNSRERNRFARLKPGDLVLNGRTSVMSVSEKVEKSIMYAGKKEVHGTIWEISTGYSGGRDINDLSIIPQNLSDNVCTLWCVS